MQVLLDLYKFKKSLRDQRFHSKEGNCNTTKTRIVQKSVNFVQWLWHCSMLALLNVPQHIHGYCTLGKEGKGMVSTGVYRILAKSLCSIGLTLLLPRPLLYSQGENKHPHDSELPGVRVGQ